MTLLGEAQAETFSDKFNTAADDLIQKILIQNNYQSWLYLLWDTLTLLVHVSICFIVFVRMISWEREYMRDSCIFTCTYRLDVRMMLARVYDEVYFQCSRPRI